MDRTCEVKYKETLPATKMYALTLSWSVTGLLLVQSAVEIWHLGTSLVPSRSRPSSALDRPVAHKVHFLAPEILVSWNFELPFRVYCSDIIKMAALIISDKKKFCCHLRSLIIKKLPYIRDERISILQFIKKNLSHYITFIRLHTQIHKSQEYPQYQNGLVLILRRFGIGFHISLGCHEDEHA